MNPTAAPAGTTMQMLGNDLVINESSCNLGCSYCLTGQSNLKSSHAGKLIFQPPIFDYYTETSDLGKRLSMIVERVREKLMPPLLKLTGGEIFIVRGILEFIEKVAPLHSAVIVQTNGLPLSNEKIQRLARLGNITVQISLDASDYVGNSYRVLSPRIHAMVLERIERVVSAGLPLEIYAVLNDRSAPHLSGLVRWCAKFPENAPQLFPFPVRGPDSTAFKVRPDQYHFIDDLQQMLPEFSHILPPKPYLERLSAFYHDGFRSWRCHLPRLVISTFDDGVVTPCPNIWFHQMGKLTDGDWDETLAEVNHTAFYELLLAEKPRLAACKGCFTPWDTLSLYFEDLISLDELCRAPSYASDGVRQLLTTKKAEYVNGRR
jgi:MoaA/NifB/PqqE/SkfB family radical SAM enzyme